MKKFAWYLISLGLTPAYDSLKYVRIYTDDLCSFILGIGYGFVWYRLALSSNCMYNYPLLFMVVI